MYLSSIVLAAALAAPGEVDAEERAAFSAAIEAKEWDAAKGRVAVLDTRLRHLRDALAAEPPPAAEKQKELAAEQTQLLAVYEKALRATRAPADLHAKVLGSAGRGGAAGEKLALRAIEWKHIHETEEPMVAALAALGARPEVKRIALYEDYLTDSRIRVAKAAIVAMGNMHGEKEATRKKVVGLLVRAYDGTGMGGEGDRQQGERANALNSPGDRMSVRHDFQFQLARLTGGIHFSTSDLWATWYRNNESSKWRDGVDKPDIKLDTLQGGPAPRPGGSH